MRSSVSEPLNLHVPTLVGYIRVEAARTMRDVFDRRTKLVAGVPGISPLAITKAMNGDETNAAYRLGLYMVGARMGGLPRSAGERLANFPQRIADLLWSGSDVCIERAMRDATRADAEEMVERTDYLASRSPVELREWIAAAERDSAELDAAIVAAHAQLVRIESGVAA